MESQMYAIAEISSVSKCTSRTSSDSVSTISAAYPNEVDVQPELSPTGDFVKPVVFKLSSLR